MVREAESFGIHWIHDGEGLSIDQSENEMIRRGKESMCLGCNIKENFKRGHIKFKSKTHHTGKKMTRSISC